MFTAAAVTNESLPTQLQATPSLVRLLFTTNLVVTPFAMLLTSWVSSRLSAKRTLITAWRSSLCLRSGPMPGSINGIVGFRAS